MSECLKVIYPQFPRHVCMKMGCQLYITPATNMMTTHQCCITASFQMIRRTCCSIIACFEFLLMLHMESLQRLSTGIKNIECAVRPPGRRRAAMPEDATSAPHKQVRIVRNNPSVVGRKPSDVICMTIRGTCVGWIPFSCYCCDWLEGFWESF